MVVGSNPATPTNLDYRDFPGSHQKPRKTRGFLFLAYSRHTRVSLGVPWRTPNLRSEGKPLAPQPGRHISPCRRCERGGWADDEALRGFVRVERRRLNDELATILAVLALQTRQTCHQRRIATKTSSAEGHWTDAGEGWLIGSAQIGPAALSRRSAGCSLSTQSGHDLSSPRGRTTAGGQSANRGERRGS